ncbi:MAG: TonB-dependent receptor plug domain-containing protein, partial [Myxococcota bacterium]
MRSLVLAALSLGVAAPAFAQEEEEIEAAEITKYPQILEAVEATYPPVALRQRISAQVALEIEISETGTISDILVTETTTIAETLSATTAVAYGIVRSSTIADYGFGDAAVDAVKRMKFSPAEVEGGIPIPVRVPFSYAFDLPPLPPPPAPPDAQDPNRPKVLVLKGLIRERGTRTRIPGVILTIFREREDGELEAYETTSDRDGSFAFYDLPPGPWRLQGEADAYFPLRDTVRVVVGEVLEVTYYLEKGNYSPYDVLVEVDPVKREVNRRTLTREEIRTVPGTLGDPILVVENLPGVARPAAGSGNIIVRGSGTNDTIVYVDGVEVPLIYHFGGLKSVLPIDVVDTVDFYPGNFSAYYGRGTGGVFDAHIRRLDPDQVHGTLEVSALDVSLFAETPIGDNAAVAVAGRRSVIGDVITAAVPDDANVGIIAAPVYYDAQVLANWTPDRGHDLRFFFLASDDRLEFLFANAADVNPQLTGNQVNTSVNFQRAVLEYRFAPNETYQNTAIVAVGRNFID